MDERSREEVKDENSGGEYTNIENKGEYFEWICGMCKWGARGYDKCAIETIIRRHSEVGCRQFAIEVEEKGLRIDD